MYIRYEHEGRLFPSMKGIFDFYRTMSPFGGPFVRQSSECCWLVPGTHSDDPARV